MAQLNRRDFLKISGVAAAMIAGNSNLFGRTRALEIINAKSNYPNSKFTQQWYTQEFETLFGQVNTHGRFDYNDTRLDVWTSGAKITRETPLSDYPVTHTFIPDANPNISAIEMQFSQTMHEADRILYPLKRVGKKGGGEWERITWDQACEDIVQKIWDTTSHYSGDEAVMIDALTQTNPAINSGVALAYAKTNVGCTYDFFSQTDVAIFWGTNPCVSHVNQAHYIWEGRYKGSKVIVLGSEYNATAKSADLWIPLQSGCDTHLAMSILHTIVSQNLYDREFISIYTDLPFLVDMETKTLLRRSFVEGVHEQSASEEFYVFDRNTSQITLVPATRGSGYESLRLDYFEIEPLLEGRWDVEVDGKKRVVTTVFEILKENVKSFAPKDTQKITGVHPEVVEQLARDIALSKKVQISVKEESRGGLFELLKIWNIASICGFTGHLGERGGVLVEREETPFLMPKNFPQIFLSMAEADLKTEILSKQKVQFLRNIPLCVYAGVRMNDQALLGDIVLPLQARYEQLGIEKDESFVDTKSSSDILLLLSQKLDEIKNTQKQNNQSDSDEVAVKVLEIFQHTFAQIPTQTRRLENFQDTFAYHQRLDTLSGRQTFFVDHPLFIEANIQTSTASMILLSNQGDYSFYLEITPSRYDTSTTLLRLQRPKPTVRINKVVATLYGIEDGDDVEIFNPKGRCIAMAKLSSSCAQDVVLMDEGWPFYIFTNKNSYHELFDLKSSTEDKLYQWGHFAFYDPFLAPQDRGIKVDLKKIEGGF